MSAQAVVRDSTARQPRATNNLQPAICILACGRSYRCVTKLTMLYQRWRQIARDNRSGFALHDARTGRQWTFGQLDAAAETGSPAGGPVVYPQDISAEFILTVLRAWRTG